MLSVIVVADSLHIIRYWDLEIDIARNDTSLFDNLGNLRCRLWRVLFGGNRAAQSTIGAGRDIREYRPQIPPSSEPNSESVVTVL